MSFPSSSSSLPPLGPLLDKQIHELDKANAGEEPESNAIPLYKMTPLQRQKYYNILNGMAGIISDNIVRPEGAVLSDLRRREQAMHASTSATSVSLYKTKTANPHYATSGPKSWQDKDGKKAALVFGNTDDTKHFHNTECTLLLDARFACGTPLDKPLPSAASQHIRFPYAGISPNIKTLLQKSNEHDSFVRLVETLKRSRKFAVGAPMSDILATIDSESSLPVASVQFRYDNCVEVVLNMDDSGTMFAVLALAACEFQPQSLHTKMRQLRLSVLEDVTKKRATDEATAKKLQPTIGLIQSTSMDQILSNIAKNRELERSYCRPHAAIAADKECTRVDRLLARSLQMSIYKPEKSETLLNTKFVFCYGYFAVCQCVLADSDLSRYKLAYGAAARSQRIVDQSVTSRTVRDRPDNFPVYDSDDDDALHNIEYGPEPTGKGDSALTKTERKRKRALKSNFDKRGALMSKEDRDKEAAQRYNSSQKRRSATMSSAHGFIKDVRVGSSVPLTKKARKK